MQRNRWITCNHRSAFLTAIAFACFIGYGSYNLAETVASNAAIDEFSPALAVRASGCITCHAKVDPSYITDFGYGDPYFFGKPGNGAKFGSFDGHIYGDFYGGEPNKTGWSTAEITQKIIVPTAPIDFDLSAAGAKLAGPYAQALKASSLAAYLRSLEAQKARPATVIEKNKIFIGAPASETLEARFGIAPGSDIKSKFIKKGVASTGIPGIELMADKSYYTNTQEIICDGDLFIRGPLFLNRAIISTESGCRIYATGPIFVQNQIAFKPLNSAVADTANLQLASAQAILLGVGDKSCNATDKDSPLSRRLVSGYAVSTFITREASRMSISPQTFGKSIYEQGKLISSLEDATCHDENVSFSRLLLNAPQVHSRYTGKFKGLVIAELALFRQGKSVYEFDPVFRKVPILPVLKESDYLQIK